MLSNRKKEQKKLSTDMDSNSPQINLSARKNLSSPVGISTNLFKESLRSSTRARSRRETPQNKNSSSTPRKIRAPVAIKMPILTMKNKFSFGTPVEDLDDFVPIFGVRETPTMGNIGV